MSTKVKGEMERWNVFLHKNTLKRLDKLAVRTGTSMADHVRTAIDQYLDARDKAALDQPRKRA